MKRRRGGRRRAGERRFRRSQPMNGEIRRQQQRETAQAVPDSGRRAERLNRTDTVHRGLQARAAHQPEAVLSPLPHPPIPSCDFLAAFGDPRSTFPARALSLPVPTIEQAVLGRGRAQANSGQTSLGFRPNIPSVSATEPCRSGLQIQIHTQILAPSQHFTQRDRFHRPLRSRNLSPPRIRDEHDNAIQHVIQARPPVSPPSSTVLPLTFPAQLSNAPVQVLRTPSYDRHRCLFYRCNCVPQRHQPLRGGEGPQGHCKSHEAELLS